MTIARTDKVIENFLTFGDWTALSNDSTGTAALTQGVVSQTSIQWDRVDGSDNKTYSGMSKAITTTTSPLASDKFWNGGFTVEDDICMVFYVGATTNIAHAFVQLGASITNSFEWRFHDSQIQANAWNCLRCRIGNCVVNGTGADLTNIAWIAVGVNFDAAGNALADCAVNSVFMARNARTMSVPVID